MSVTTFIFDFGNVINKWEPEKALLGLYPIQKDVQAAMDRFAFKQWVGSVLDMGQDVEASLLAFKGSNHEKYIMMRTYMDRIALAHATPIAGTSELIMRLSDQGYQILGMTNCGHAAFEALMGNFDVIKVMDDIFVSANEGICKPDAHAYRLLLDRNSVKAEHCIFIDDAAKNVDAAKALGMDGIVFIDANSLEHALAERGILVGEAAE